MFVDLEGTRHTTIHLTPPIYHHPPLSFLDAPKTISISIEPSTEALLAMMLPALLIAFLATLCNAFHAPFGSASLRLPTSWFSHSTAVENDELIACIKSEIEASM